jgi:predicted DNA-binding transcriptional regulator AlpA
MPFHTFRKFRAPEAAAYLGIAESTLAKMRLRGDGPRFIKAGKRIVLYDQADLEAWLDARRRLSTSDPGTEPKRYIQRSGMVDASDDEDGRHQ